MIFRGISGRRFSFSAPLCIAALLASLVALACSCGGSFERVRSVTEPPSKRSAILVLPGMRLSAKGRRAMQAWYSKQPYDVFIPDYYERESLAASRASLASYIEESGILEYEEVNVFSYLLGAWSLNAYLQDHDFPNMKRIIYDRSAYQEQVSHMVLENIPNIIFSFYGKTVRDFSRTPYPPIEHGDLQIGLMIECRASPYARRNKRQLTPVGRQHLVPEAFGQPYDDHMYIFRHHDEMYYSFDAVGPEILAFFENGRFTAGAQRTPCERDPFQ